MIYSRIPTLSKGDKIKLRETEDDFKEKYNLLIHPCSELGTFVAILNNSQLKLEITHCLGRLEQVKKIQKSLQRCLGHTNSVLDDPQYHTRELVWINDNKILSGLHLYDQLLKMLESAREMLDEVIKVEKNSLNRHPPKASREKDYSGDRLFSVLSVLIRRPDNKTDWQDIDKLLDYYLQWGSVFVWLERYSGKKKKYTSQNEYKKLKRTLKVKKKHPSSDEEADIRTAFLGIRPLSRRFIDPHLSYLNPE